MGLTRLFGGASGITNQPQGLDIGISGSNIKSIQRGTVTLNPASSVNVTISTVDLSKSIVKFKFINSDDLTVAKGTVQGQLTSSTNINFQTTTIPSFNVKVVWEVVEFNNVKSLQRGSADTFSFSSPFWTKDITISAVNMSKSIVFSSSSTANGTTSQYLSLVGEFLLNSTTLRCESGASNQFVQWQVIEFN